MSKVLATKYQVDLLAINESKVRREDIKAPDSIFHNVVLFDFNSTKLKLNALKKLPSRKPIQVAGYYFPAIQKWIEKHFQEYDLIYCNHVRTADYARNLPCRKVIDLVDAISMNYKIALGRAKGFWKAFYSVEDKRLLPYELGVLQDFNKCFITSPVDQQYLLQHATGHADIQVIPNGVSEKVLEHKGGFQEEDWISFLGKMDYYPNEDAVIYFAKEILPLVRAVNRGVEFLVVGAYPTKKILKLNDIPGVKVTGFVDDPYEYLARSKLVVAPMRFGAGIQNKVLEAMALRKTVVTTSRAVAAIEGQDGKHFVIADTASEMADKILELLRNEEERRIIGENARALIEEKYTWTAVGDRLLKEIEAVEEV